MGWTLSNRPQPRTPGEQYAYCEGFRAGAGLAVEYMAEGKPLDKVLGVAVLLEEAAKTDADHHRT